MKARLFVPALVSATVFCQPCPALPQDAAQAPPQKMDNFSLSGLSDKGKKNWDLRGRSADIGARVIDLDDVESHLYGENTTVKLTADQGRFDRQQGSLHLEKDVVITSSSGARLTTDSLDWNRGNQTVSTVAPVNIEKQDVFITGRGALGRTDLDRVDLQKDVSVKIDQRSDPTVITCDGPLQVDYGNNTAVFNTNVKVRTRDCVIESDKMDLAFVREGPPGAAIDRQASRIQTITARGNVTIRRGDNISYCDEAVYTAADRKIRLSGNPKLVIYSEDVNAPAGN